MVDQPQSMSQSDQIDEAISERQFFWAVTQKKRSHSLNQHWIAYGYHGQFAFADFWDLHQGFCDYLEMNSEADEDAIEIFLAQQIWLHKCAHGIDSFADRNLGIYLLSIDYHQWLFQTNN